MRQGVVLNFGGIEEPGSYAEARCVVLPVPYDGTTTYQPGTRRGPLAILEASGHMELYDHELGNSPIEHGIWTLPPLVSEASGPEQMVASVRQAARPLFRDGKFVLTLGGEHSITLGAIQACKELHPELRVLQLDAHADMRDSYEGSPFSHACVMRRVVDLGVPVVQVGIRSLSEEEVEPIRQSRVTTLFAEQHPTSEQVVTALQQWGSGPVYVTFDLDALDPSIMPATGTPEPGGLLWEQALDILRAVTRTCSVVATDLVELAPIPGMVAPDFLAAKLAYKIIGYALGAARRAS
ncbi:MAG: agmatinase [candidate division KSB1 bacterium]|nr:agmatinase [candidate division KSB1 bacterium]MDZ7392551.1 agmatinase [candidate division KSB1 bacterium]